jgi:hypothetical protein
VQVVAHKLAEMKTALSINRAFVDQCLLLHHEGRLDTATASMAKVRPQATCLPHRAPPAHASHHALPGLAPSATAAQPHVLPVLPSDGLDGPRVEDLRRRSAGEPLHSNTFCEIAHSDSSSATVLEGKEKRAQPYCTLASGGFTERSSGARGFPVPWWISARRACVLLPDPSTPRPPMAAARRDGLHVGDLGGAAARRHPRAPHLRWGQ